MRPRQARSRLDRSSSSTTGGGRRRTAASWTNYDVSGRPDERAKLRASGIRSTGPASPDQDRGEPGLRAARQTPRASASSRCEPKQSPAPTSGASTRPWPRICRSRTSTPPQAQQEPGTTSSSRRSRRAHRRLAKAWPGWAGTTPAEPGRHQQTGWDGRPGASSSCQQNFTIITTDGYWNSQTEWKQPRPSAAARS